MLAVWLATFLAEQLQDPGQLVMSRQLVEMVVTEGRRVLAVRVAPEARWLVAMVARLLLVAQVVLAALVMLVVFSAQR